MGRIEIDVPKANGEAAFSGFTLKWLSAFKMDEMVIRGRLSIHLQEAPKLSKEWGEGHTVALCWGEKRSFSSWLDAGLTPGLPAWKDPNKKTERRMAIFFMINHPIF